MNWPLSLGALRASGTLSCALKRLLLNAILLNEWKYLEQSYVIKKGQESKGLKLNSYNKDWVVTVEVILLLGGKQINVVFILLFVCLFLHTRV